jgi:prenyltransferase beta subunit
MKETVKAKHLVSLIVAVFMASLLLSTILVQAQTQNLVETRKSALLTTLGESQFDDGSFPDFLYANETEGGTHEIAQVLCIGKILNALNRFRVDKAIEYTISKQSVKIGNATLWGFPGPVYENQTVIINDLYICHEIIGAMKYAGALDRLNKTALVDVALSRYDESNGAFHEPVITVESAFGIENHTFCVFPLEFHGDNSLAYARPNVISTFLGISILADLEALNMINTTKTLEWLLSCEATNGVFKPFPESDPDYLPPWSSMRTNPFYVDSYGTGIAYTYAALGALEALNVDIKSVVEVEKVIEYVLSCRQSYPWETMRFVAYPDSKDTPAFPLTYYALMSLHYVGALSGENDVASKVGAYALRILQDPDLRPGDSWPLPSKSSRFYGLFMGFPPLLTTYFAVLTLNVTDRLNLLDQSTPIVSKTWYNLLTLSVIASGSTLGLSIMSMLTYNKIQARKQKKKDSELPPSVVA